MSRAASESPAPATFDERSKASDASCAAPGASTHPASGSGKGKEALRTAPKVKKSWMDGIEAWISRLASRNNFWHRVTSLIWLPYAFRSGIKVKRVDSTTFTAVLPFKRFNRNWYNAMAGAALLANSEISGGMYVFGVAGGDYTVVCKKLSYRFLRPCFGPALYKISPRENVAELVKAGGEFNIGIDIEIVQQLPIKRPEGSKGREVRVGRCEATFHCTPKIDVKARKARAKSDR
ncbi:MAG: hypothetical protein ACTS27_02980 [Phycisphaerales bacterium]